VVIDSVIFIFAIATALCLARRISRPLALVVKSAEDIANGKLEHRATLYSGNDEIGDLTKAFNYMASNLRKLVAQVIHAAEQVSASSGQLTASAKESAQAAEQILQKVASVAAGAGHQATAVDQVVSVVRQMAAAISHIANNANDVSGKSGEAFQAAEVGGQAALEGTDQM
jgi:methyl-accepting chemotaxis protein